MENADLGEARLAVQSDRCIVGQDDACEGNMYRFAGEVFEQRAVQSSADTLATAADVECDADLNGLPEAFVVPVRLAGGIAQYLVAVAGNKEPVRAGRGEPLEPGPPFGHCGGLAGESGVGVRDRVVEDRHDRGKIVLSCGPDLDGARTGRREGDGPMVHVRASLPVEARGNTVGRWSGWSSESMARMIRRPISRSCRGWVLVSGSKTRRRTSWTWPGAASVTVAWPWSVRIARV